MLQGVKKIALLVVLVFGCTTVRVAALPESEVVDAPGTIAPPVVELWLESSGPVPRPEADSAAEAAQAAISQAVSQVQISPSALGAADPVLFVRERGVALTEAREHQQTWAKIGIVAAVAAVIIAVVASSGHGGGGRHYTRAGPPRATGGGVVRSVGRPVAPIYRGPRYIPRSYPVPIFIGFNFFIPVQPLIYRPDPVDDPPPFPPDAPFPLAPGAPDDALAMNGGPPPPEEPPAPPEQPALELPHLQPPADFAVDDRGFFDGSHIGLQLDLLDRATGQLLWSKPIASDGNPCSAKDVDQLVRSALAGQSWARPMLSVVAR
jgi:hypothetical protein